MSRWNAMRIFTHASEMFLDIQRERIVAKVMFYFHPGYHDDITAEMDGIMQATREGLAQFGVEDYEVGYEGELKLDGWNTLVFSYPIGDHSLTCSYRDMWIGLPEARKKLARQLYEHGYRESPEEERAREKLFGAGGLLPMLKSLAAETDVMLVEPDDEEKGRGR